MEETTKVLAVEEALNDLSGFQRDALRNISCMDEPHGLAVKKALEGEYETEVNHGRLYPNLDELVNLGLLSKGKKDQRTNYYKLTRTGAEVCQVMADKWEKASN